MTNRFDPTQVEQHLKRSARLRSDAVSRAFEILRRNVKHAAHRLIVVFV